MSAILIAAGVLLGAGLLTVFAWLVYSVYLDRVERRLAERKGLYRELVSELATRDRALLEPTIHKMSTLYDLDALEAVLEEQARTAIGRPGWLLEVYDQLGLVDKYIEKLRNARKWRDRAFAAELLGRVGSAKAVPALLQTVQATQTEDADVREIALRALARIADPRAVEPLIRALANAETWLAPRIADILTRHGAAVIEPLTALLAQSSTNPARAWAANVLGEVRAQAAFPVLVRALDDPDDEVRAKAATALGRLGDQRAINHLLERLLTDPAPFVRGRMAATLGQFGGPEVIDRLVHALGDPAWWVRMRSVEALEQIGTAAEGPLIVALDDGDREIRRRAAVALERLGVAANLVRMMESGAKAPEASPHLARLAAAGTRELLAELLAHPFPAVRDVALTAIRREGRHDLASELIQRAAADSEPSLRAAALDALRVLRLQQALPAALTGAIDPDSQVRATAIRLAGTLGGAETLEVARAHTADPDPGVRAAAAAALGAMKAHAALDDLARLMDDPASAVRQAAVLAVAEARLRQLVPAVIELLGDREEEVRAAAARSIAILGDRAAVPGLLRAYPAAPPNLREGIAAAVSRLEPGAMAGLIDDLIERDDTSGKLSVAHLLGRMRQPEALELLGRLSQDPDPEVRAAALEALGRSPRFREPAAALLADAVAAGLEDTDRSVRAAAVDLCGRICLPDQGARLVELLQADTSPLVRERAAIAVGLLQVSGSEAALISASRPEEAANVRAAATLALGAFDQEGLIGRVVEMPDQTAVRELLRRRLKDDPWFRLLSRKLPRARDLELRALATSGSGNGPVALAAGFRSTLEAGERVRLISGLRAFEGEQSRLALLQIVRGDPSPEVRTAALMAAADLLDPDELLAFGTRSLGDPSIMVRRAAVGLFSRVVAERACPRLIQALRVDDDPAVLAEVAALAEEQFSAFRDAASAAPLSDARLVLVTRISRYIQHPELAALILPFSSSSAPTVREAVAELWRHRPDLVDSAGLEALSLDPVISVRSVAAGAAALSERYDLLDRMTQDPDPGVRREVAITLAHVAPVRKPGLLVLERLEADTEMPVRAAAHASRLFQGIPVPLPPGLDPDVAAEAVRDAGSLASLREIARSAPGEDRRLAAALALALVQDEVAHEVARTDPAPAIRHRVGGALELTIQRSAEAR
jgi:HEAT repeat protein